MFIQVSFGDADKQGTLKLKMSTNRKAYASYARYMLSLSKKAKASA